MGYLQTFIFQFLFFALISLVLHTKLFDKLFSTAKKFRLLLLGLLVVYLFFIGSLKKEVGDVMLFSGAGYYFRNGVDFYTIDVRHEQYPFFPFLIFFHALGNRLSEIFPYFTFSFFLKLLILLPSLFFIARLIYKRAPGQYLARKNSFSFLASPITYSAVLFHGQTDVFLLALFFASSLLFLSSAKKNPFSSIISGILFGCSLATKTWSIIFLPLLFRNSSSFTKFFLFFVSALGLLFVDVFVYTRLVASAFRLVLPAVSRAGGPIGIWGWTFILSFISGLLDWVTAHNLLVFSSLLTLLVLSIFLKKTNFFVTCLMMVLGFYLITPNWGIQYLFWALPLIYLVPVKASGKFSHWFHVLASVFMFLNYLNVAAGAALLPTFYVNIFGLVLWFTIAVWQFKLYSMPALPANT